MLRKSTTVLAAVGLAGVAWLHVLAGDPGASSPADGANEAGRGWAGWHVLRLKARGVPLFTGNLTFTVTESDGRRVLATESVARFCGATVSRSTSETVLDAKTGRPTSYVAANRKRERRYRFADEGYVVEKWVPAEKGAAESGEWVLQSSAEHPYPRDAEHRPVPVLDPWGLLLYLEGLDLREVGDEVTVQVAGSRGPVPYRIRISEERDSTRRPQDLDRGGKRTVTGREVRLRIEPAEPEDADEGFLNMEGEIELWVDARTKTPLYISGKVPHVPGKVRLLVDGVGNRLP